LVSIAFAGFEKQAQAVNLVPNPDFETFLSCPVGGCLSGTVAEWTCPTTGTADYFHTCDTTGGGLSTPANMPGSQAPTSGVAYAGFIAYEPPGFLGEYREYLEVELISPLVGGQTYAVHFLVSLADNSPYAVEEIGAYLQAGSVGPVPNPNPLPYVPQVEYTGGPIIDKIKWKSVFGAFVAVGGEDHLVIGNFRDDANTTIVPMGPSIGHWAYYYVEDVSVTPIDEQCHPTPDGQACSQGCFVAGEQCTSKEILADASGNFLEITCCDCLTPGCHIQYNPINQQFGCVGASSCPGGSCQLVGKGNLDGTITYSCGCDAGTPEPCAFESGYDVECNQGTSYERCSGACPTPSDECIPDTIIALEPVPGGHFSATCECTEIGLNPCRPIRVNGVVVECTGVCPQGTGPCNLVSYNLQDGSVEYDCSCEPPPVPCEPSPPPGSQCGGDCAVQGEICVPQQITADANGNFLAIECCDCVPLNGPAGPECHVDYDPIGQTIFCANPCNDPDLECTLMGKGNADGTITYECECIDISTPLDCGFVTECNPCVNGTCQKHCKGLCPPPFDACVPREITDDGSGLGNLTVTDCDCGEVGPDHCRPVINPATLAVECVGSCPNMQPCVRQEVLNADGTISYSCPPCGAEEIGACCVSQQPGAGTFCIQSTMDDCENIHNGLWIGVGIPCTPDPCPEEPTPCCIDDPCEAPVCQMLTPTACEAAGGSSLYWVFPPSCTPDPCVEGTGACCAPVQGATTCQILTAQECNGQFGVYFGDGTTCTPDPCADLSTKDCGVAQCCQRPPRFTDPNYAGFVGPVAIETCQPLDPMSAYPEHIIIFDITNRASAPLDIDWPGVPRYSHPSWDVSNLGSIFGLTLDKQGNLYVTDTSSYSIDNMGPGGWGSIYKINNTTALPSTFATLPNTGPGLGNIAFDCRHNQFYVTNMEDGKIYRLSLAGTVLSTFDHGLPDNGAAGFAPLGERLWGVAVYNNRVYYSVWNRHSFVGVGFNQIWSVSLGCGGGGADFCAGSAQLEISIPLVFTSSIGLSQPVSDISFTTQGCMLISERTMSTDTFLGAHNARVLEYCIVGTSWTSTGHLFDIGDLTFFPGQNAAGGVDYDIDGNVWASGDALKLGTQAVYGLQSLPGAGGTTANSVLIDRDGSAYIGEKTQQGDVELPCLGCVKAPIKLAAWWPFDEPVPPIANDLTMVNDGTHANGPVITPGKVSRALNFDGINDAVTVPDNSTLDFPNLCTFFFSCPVPQDFSIDAWVRTCEDNLIQPIVDKLNSNPFWWNWTNGYYFYLDNGVPALQMADQALFGGGVSTFLDTSSTNVADGNWHHVAVTLDRDQVNGGVFYVDGVPVSTFNPTPRNRGISNSYPLWIGMKQTFPFAMFNGDIDEVQIFRRSVPATEIQAIYAAQNAGKCKDRCAVPPKLTYPGGATSINGVMTLCNDSTVTHNYSWTMTGLPSGGACTISGPTIFTPSSGLVTIPAGTCLNILVNITAPPGLVFGQTACYDFSATNIETGGMTSCTGQLGRSKWFIVWGGDLGSSTKISVGRRTLLSFDVTNDSEDSGMMEYHIRLTPRDAEAGAPSIVSLNGLPPGEPVIDTLMLPVGQSTTISVQATVLEHWPLHPIDLHFDQIGPGAVNGLLGEPETIHSHILHTEFVQPAAPLAASAPHNRDKNRYISFSPNSGGVPMIYRVSKLSTGEGPIGWVGPPNAQGRAQVFASMPPPRVWTETTVHLGDCEITPVSVFEIEGTQEGTVFSEPLIIATAGQPQGKSWGDAVGVNNGVEWTPPNGLANVQDVVGVLAYIQGNAIRPEFEAVNLEAVSAADACLNNLVNTADLFIMVKAVAGDPYPFTTNPALCQGLCP